MFTVLCILHIGFGTNPFLINIKITNGDMAQLVLECSGSASAIKNAIKYVANAGRITLTGWPDQVINIDTGLITKKEVDILGARTSAGEFEEAIAFMVSGKINMEKLVTHTVSLADAADCIKEMERSPEKFMKTIVLR